MPINQELEDRIRGAVLLLAEQVAKSWPIDRGHYTRFPENGDIDRLRFTIGHCLLHQQKTTGKLAGIIDKLDHGLDDTVELEQVKRLAAEQVINSLRLIAAINVNDIVSEITLWLEESHKYTNKREDRT